MKHETINSNLSQEKTLEIISSCFTENTSILNRKGKIIGNIKENSFYGHADYSTQIKIKGKVLSLNENSSQVELHITEFQDKSHVLIYTFGSMAAFVALLFMVINNPTGILSYIVPIIILGCTYIIGKFEGYFNKDSISSDLVIKNLEKKIAKHSTK